MAKGKIEIDTEKCKGCHLCVEFCPKQCIAVSQTINDKGYFPAEPVKVDGEEVCTGCTLCAVVCPDIAIEVYRG
jgi:2-oxoglutarate ferredoxin oxidoreductase subunit delta